jgi:hypothetical protein
MPFYHRWSGKLSRFRFPAEAYYDMLPQSVDKYSRDRLESLSSQFVIRTSEFFYITLNN